MLADTSRAWSVEAQSLTRARAPSNVCLMDSTPPASKIMMGAKFTPSWLPYST
jgi:hypothetical protein